MRNLRNDEICARVTQLRVKVCGRRGKTAFARKLGIGPSTYDYYEKGRPPPAYMLEAMADLAEVDLGWLITGHEPVAVDPRLANPIIKRAAELLAERPNAAPALEAFLDILSESMNFPTKAPVAPDKAADGPAEAGLGTEIAPEADWIPILGRSAAGVPHFWSTYQAAERVTELSELIDLHARDRQRQVRPGWTSPSEGESPIAVQIIVLDKAASGGVEFVSCPAIKAKWADSFAVRIDGESMAPTIVHGDLVILSASQPAADGLPAVVQLAGQIGVTCKLYRSSDEQVHLVPLNESFAPQAFAAGDVHWALRVLATVRPEQSEIYGHQRGPTLGRRRRSR